jgi:enoyl-CoA hydratase
MEFENIILSRQEEIGTATVTLNRPKFLNALNNQTLSELSIALEELDQDSEIKVVLLTGNEKAFAAGADLNQLATASVVDQLKNNRAKLWKSITSFSKPLIAVVDGFALGAGCELALLCDFIICSDKAMFGQPELNVGTIPGGGGTQRLTKILGKSKSMYHILTGEFITADEAEKINLVAKIFPSSCLRQESLRIAKAISSKPPLSIKLAKEAVNYSFESTLAQGLEFERRNFYLSFSTEDQKEGAQAFLEKRSPTYQGK